MNFTASIVHLQCLRAEKEEEGGEEEDEEIVITINRLLMIKEMTDCRVVDSCSL